MDLRVRITKSLSGKISDVSMIAVSSLIIMMSSTRLGSHFPATHWLNLSSDCSGSDSSCGLELLAC